MRTLTKVGNALKDSAVEGHCSEVLSAYLVPPIAPTSDHLPAPSLLRSFCSPG